MMSTLTTFRKHCMELLARAITQINNNNEIQRVQFGKKEVKLFLFTDDMTVYIENSKKSTTKKSKLVKEFSKDADSRSSTYKNHLHSCSLAIKKSKNKIKQTISFKVDFPSSCIRKHIPKFTYKFNSNSIKMNNFNKVQGKEIVSSTNGAETI